MALNWPDKDPDEVLDYCLDWSDRLGSSDTISTSTWIVPTGIVADNESNTDTTATLWLSSGMAGRRYDILNRIVTTEGRTMDHTVSIRIRSS